MDESKRSFIKQSLGLIAASGVVAGGLQHADALEPPEVPTSMKVPGAGMSEYGSPAKYERKVTRTLIHSQRGTTGSGASRTAERLTGHPPIHRQPSMTTPDVPPQCDYGRSPFIRELEASRPCLWAT